MKTFFQYFLPWCFFKSTKGIVNLQKGYIDLYEDNAFIGGLVGILITLVLCLLALAGTEAYGSLNHMNQEARVGLLSVAGPIAIIIGGCYTITIGIIVAYRAFQKEQQELLDKLSGKYNDN